MLLSTCILGNHLCAAATVLDFCFWASGYMLRCMIGCYYTALCTLQIFSFSIGILGSLWSLSKIPNGGEFASYNINNMKAHTPSFWCFDIRIHKHFNPWFYKARVYTIHKIHKLSLRVQTTRHIWQPGFRKVPDPQDLAGCLLLMLSASLGFVTQAKLEAIHERCHVLLWLSTQSLHTQWFFLLPVLTQPVSSGLPQPYSLTVEHFEHEEYNLLLRVWRVAPWYCKAMSRWSHNRVCGLGAHLWHSSCCPSNSAWSP